MQRDKMITVVETSTSERKAETRRIFEDVKPYLDRGYSLVRALEATGNNDKRRCSSRGWFKDLTDYMDSHGYYHRDYQYNRRIQ